MYECSICKTEAIVDHINPPQFNCECEGRKCVTNISGNAYGRGSMGESQINNNLSEASALILKNALFALTADEFFNNEKEEAFAKNLIIKDSVTGKEFSFTLTGNKI